jgi:hypothetical protein
MTKSRQRSAIYDDDEQAESLLLEIQRRRAARASLLRFTEYTRPGWHAAPVHTEICRQLERVFRGEIDRLGTGVPPQFGKSTVCSKAFPAFVVGHRPASDIVIVSATADLAVEFGRDIRNTIASPEYRALFPGVSLAADSQAAGRWHTNQGGSFYSIGIGGALYGRGFELAIIDDPFSTWEDAQSEVERKRVKEWFDGSLYNRVRPGGAIVLIQHRLHEDDLFGHLLATMANDPLADHWETVNLKASPDLWPERYDQAALNRLRANMHPLKWSALYMQDPLPDEGTFFRRENLPLVPLSSVPAVAHRYTSGDFAVSEDRDADETDIATHAYVDGTIYLGLEGWHGRKTSDVWIEGLIDQFERHRPFAFFGEGGVIRRAIEPFLNRRMLERKRVVHCEWITRSKDKSSCALSLQGLAMLGKVKIVDSDYGRHLLSQLVKFPQAQHDDAVDMAVNFAMAIDQAHPAVLPPPKFVPQKKMPPRSMTLDAMIARAERSDGEYERI